MTMAQAFERARGRNEMALIPYVTAGYPNTTASLAFLDAAVAAGADAIEIGLPFSDPVADGPTIQYASHEALKNGFRPRPFLEALARRARTRPIVLMTYLNPLLALGERGFDLLAASGVVALVVPDLPESESQAVSSDAARAGIDLVLLASPTSSAVSLTRIGAGARGFVYVVGVVGTTGTRSEIDPALPATLARTRAVTTL